VKARIYYSKCQLCGKVLYSTTREQLTVIARLHLRSHGLEAEPEVKVLEVELP